MSEKEEKQGKKKWRSTLPNFRTDLVGKGVLLIGEDSAILRPLITQLAQKGADIALIGHNFSRDTIRRFKETADSTGRRFLLINASDEELKSPGRLIQNIKARLGHLDIFIDLSAYNRERQPAENGTRSVAEYFDLNWRLNQVVLEEIGGI